MRRAGGKERTGGGMSVGCDRNERERQRQIGEELQEF